MTDEIDKLITDDPNLTQVEGEQQAWLLTGDDVKTAKEALNLPPDESPAAA